MKRTTPISIMMLGLALLTILPCLAIASQRSVYVHSAEGANIHTELGPEIQVLPSSEISTTREDEVLWQRTITGNIYSTSACSAYQFIFAGSTNGATCPIELHDAYGDGTPQWTYGGEPNYVDGASEVNVLGGIEQNSAINGVTVSCWDASIYAPNWSVDIPDCNMGVKGVQVADNGSVIAVAVYIPAAEGYTRLYHFDAATGTQLSSFDCAPLGNPRALCISFDGSLSAVRAGATLYVVETATGAQRWTAPIGASADPLAFSGDGQWLASGWTSLRVYRWNGETYQFAWTGSGGAGWYLRTCALSATGNSLVAGWYKTSYNQIQVQMYHPLNSTPEWTYLSPISNGVYQELPSDAAVDMEDGYAVVGSWGDSQNLNPEIHVFSRQDPDPMFTVDSPGSIFDVDIQAVGITRSVVAIAGACGKHTHANELGSGGDLFSIHIFPPTAGQDAPAAQAALAAYPNPFNPQVTLSYELAQSGPVALDIFDISGRCVRHLVSSTQDAGSHQARWDGRTAAGTGAVSGVYLAKLVTAAGASSERLVLMR